MAERYICRAGLHMIYEYEGARTGTFVAKCRYCGWQSRRRIGAGTVDPYARQHARDVREGRA